MKWWVQDGWLRAEDAHSEYQIRVRPHPEAWRKTPPDPFWRHCIPELPFPDRECSARIRQAKARLRRESVRQMHFPFDYESYQPCRFPRPDNPEAMEWLLRGLPRITRKLLREDVLPGEEWNLLLYLDLFGRPAAELMGHNPVLGGMLFEKFGYRITQGVKEPWHQEFRRDLRGRQRGLLRWCGIPEEERMVRLLGKMDPGMKWFYDEMGSVLEKMRHFKVLGHLPRISLEVWMALQVECDHPGTLSPAFLLELARASSCPARWFDLNFELLTRIQKITGIRQGPFHSPEQLERHFEDLKRRADDLPLAAGVLEEIPGLPWEGTEEIVPLRNNHEYLQEALKMRHCVMSEFHRAVDGDVAHFRVLAPERATLEIQRTSRNADWTVSQLQGPCNRPVAESTRLRVEEVVRSITSAEKNREIREQGSPSCRVEHETIPF